MHACLHDLEHCFLFVGVSSPGMTIWLFCLCRKRKWTFRDGCCWKVWLQCNNMLWLFTSGNIFVLFKVKLNELLRYSSSIITFITISFSCFRRKMTGRLTGCHFTLSRGCNTKSTWLKSLMETGRPWNSGLNYRCTTKNCGVAHK